MTAKTRQLIQDVGESSFIGISTGFWYEWSLAIPSAFGIDLLEHKATFYDDGETKISVATWPQVRKLDTFYRDPTYWRS